MITPITLAELRTLSKEIFPNIHAGLAHLLYAWATRDPEGELAALLLNSGIGTIEMLTALAPLLTVPANEDKELLISCIMSIKSSSVTGQHLLRAICAAPAHRISEALTAAGLNIAKLQRRLDEQQTKLPASVLAQYGITVDTKVSPILQYGRDLTALAKEGAFDELCDRPKEIDRLLEVLLRKRKGNPILTGPAGVGKTALVELLARMLAVSSVSGVIPGTRIFELNMGKLVAGTKYRGEFEQRLEEVLQAFIASQPAILFIDEIHLIWGTGRAEGAPMDAGNLMKPFLARSDIHIRVIGATTLEEYNRYIAQDTALARRFQEIRLGEPDMALTLEMVQKQADALAKHHGVQIPDSVVTQAIELTNRHIPNRWQPDKSMDLLDSAMVRVRREGKKEITTADLLETLSHQTDRPVAALTGEDRASLQNLSASLKKRIIGQDHAIEKVVATLIQRRQDVGSAERNLGTFLFVGDTGVGKTELARAIASVFFGSEKSLLHLDLAEYSQPGSAYKLIGSPLGFIDSEKEGKLTAWLHAHGSGVILFDEIDKAYPEVHRLLLGLLDNGRISSARGETMDTRQCVVILTTNAITSAALNRKSIGFKPMAVEPDPAELLLDHFPREFLGRLDEIILFNRLGPEEMRRIMKLRLDEALARLSHKNIHVIFDETKLLDYLIAGLESNCGM